MYRKTAVVAEQLGIAETHIYYLIRARKVAKPSRDSSGDFQWDDAGVEAIRQALKIDRRRKAAIRA